MTAGSDTGNGRASSVTESVPSRSRAMSARRVGSARAANVRSSEGVAYLTIKLSLSRCPDFVKRPTRS